MFRTPVGRFFHAATSILLLAATVVPLRCLGQATVDILEKPQPDDWIALGAFAKAEEYLRSRIPDEAATVTTAEAIQLEILRRIRLDFSLSEEDVLRQERASIPDVMVEDLLRWPM
jgi:hypothetical protein